MKPETSAGPASRAALAMLALVALVGGGCSQKLTSQLVPNQAPQVRLITAPVARDSLRPDFYAYALQWVGYDPDGRVDHFLYAVDAKVDPLTGKYDLADTIWHRTVKNEQTFFFSAGHPIEPVDIRNPKAESPHKFTIYAVDNLGAVSKQPAERGFFSFTQAPLVVVTDPRPNAAFIPSVTPTVTIRWTGQDPDGQFTNKPVRWVFKLFSQGTNPDFPNIEGDFISFATNFPDSLRKLYAPESDSPFAGFRGWTSVGAETTSFQYRNLTPEQTYLFVLTGFDEAGAYDPVFAPGRNMLRFQVTLAGVFGPVITMFNQFFSYTYLDGRYDSSPARWFRLEVPAKQKVTFNWFGTPPEGADMKRYRWVMDLVDLTDETPRKDATDVQHWSDWSLNTTSATIGPFLINDETHLFYIEAEDNNNLKSLGIIFFKVVLPTFVKPLLFVDDTRLKVDIRSLARPEVDGPSGPWPTAAELDTFLFAKGGFPWRDYPAGTVSPPGIFNGYDYDTLGTRGISLDGFVPLSVLGLYRHVVWYVDETGATYRNLPIDRDKPTTALRLVNSPGRPVILSTYMAQGGLVWLCGGGAAAATLFPWNKAGTSPSNYTARDGELIPGRMMYDFAHWREGVEMLSDFQATRFGTNSFGAGSNRPGRGWPPNPIPPTPSTPPDYSLLPPSLLQRTPTTDPPPPLRTVDSSVYPGRYPAEYIYLQTFIREDYNDNPDILEEYSTLDTLYITSGGRSARPFSPTMTYYHGRDNAPLVFSGFNFWVWQRTHCIQLVDWVLQSVWRLERDPTAPRAPSVPMSARRAGAVLRLPAAQRPEAVVSPAARRADAVIKTQAARRAVP